MIGMRPTDAKCPDRPSAKTGLGSPVTPVALPCLDAIDFRGAPEIAYVYAVTDNGLRHKLGMAVNMKRRLATLQTGHSEILRLTDILTVARGRERIVERAIHLDLGFRRLRGEWFEIDAGAVRTLFAFARIRWVDDPLLGF